MSYTDKETQREYNREWVRKRREAYFKDKACEICGSTDRLELDHKDPATKVSHNIWSWSETRRDNELAKCRPLCFICHKDKSKHEHPIGIKNHNSKLTEDQVKDIRQRYVPGIISYQVLANEFNMSKSAIRYAIKGDHWKHIELSS